MSGMSEDDVRRMLANPFYAITVAPIFCEEHEPIVSEDQWIAAAARDIEENGAEEFCACYWTFSKATTPARQILV
jgi:hypothetical protein